MALVMYHDSDCNEPIDESNPDYVKEAVQQGSDFEDEKEFWIKSDDEDLTYENVELTASGDTDSPSSGQVDIKYSKDDGETYEDTVDLEDGDYQTAVSIYRKVYSPDVQEAFNESSIKHQINADEFAV